MQLLRAVSAEEVSVALLWFKLFCMPDLERRLGKFDSEATSNPLLAQYYRETFKLEYSIASLLEVYKPGQPIPIHEEYAEATNFIVTLVRVYQNLSSKGKERLAQDLTNTFAQTYGMRPLAFEMTVAAHYLGKGCDLTFVDIEGTGRFEFLVQKDGQKLEVECKTISADAGRVIDRLGLCRLGPLFLPTLKEHLTDKPLVLTVKIKRRLIELSQSALKELPVAARRAFLGEKISPTADFSMNAASNPALVLPPNVNTQDEISRFVHDKVGGLGRHIMIHGSVSNRKVSCIIFESETPDDVLRYISGRAAGAGEQFSRQNPSMVAIQIADMPKSALEELMNLPGVGINKISENVFEGPPRRPHVNAVAFSVMPVPEIILRAGPEISNISAHVALIRNPKAKFESAALENGNPFSVT